MLRAKLESVDKCFRKRMLEIREGELDYYLANAQHIATLSALLLGLTSCGLTDARTPEYDLNGELEGHLFSDHLLPVAILVHNSLCTYSCWASMLVCMLAPRLALHGPPSCYSRTVDAVEETIDEILMYFKYSLATFGTCALLWAWASLGDLPALLTTALVVVTPMVFYGRFARVRQLFTLRPEATNSGRWFADRFGYVRLSEEDDFGRGESDRVTMSARAVTALSSEPVAGPHLAGWRGEGRLGQPSASGGWHVCLSELPPLAGELGRTPTGGFSMQLVDGISARSAGTSSPVS